MYSTQKAKNSIDSLTYQLHVLSVTDKLSNGKCDEVIEELEKLQSYIQSYGIDYVKGLRRSGENE